MKIGRKLFLMISVMILMAGILITILGILKYGQTWDNVGLLAIMAGVAVMGVGVYQLVEPKK